MQADTSIEDYRVVLTFTSGGWLTHAVMDDGVLLLERVDLGHVAQVDC